MKITPDFVREHGLSDSEYDHVLKLLGREPSYVELGIFSGRTEDTQPCRFKDIHDAKNQRLFRADNG